MANTGFKGLSVRQTGSELIFDAFLQSSAGALITAGTTTVKLYELQSDGTLKSYDFNDNTFKTTALTTETLAMTHRTGNNAGTNTGYWSAALSTLTGFTVGAVYLALVNNSTASPTDQMRKFQYGSAEGDLLTTAGTTGQAYLESDLRYVGGSQIIAPNVAGALVADIGYVNGTAAAVAGTVDANLTQINGDATAAANQALAAKAIYSGTATSGSATTLVDASLGSGNANAYKNRVVIFTGSVTAALQYQAALITAYDAAAHTLTFSAIPSGAVPANGDTYIIV